MTAFSSYPASADRVAQARKPPTLPWPNEAAGAPFNRRLWLQARDQTGLYVLPFVCMRTDDGFCNARTRRPLSVEIIAWKAA